MRSASAIFMSRTEAITCLPQIVTLRGCAERMKQLLMHYYGRVCKPKIRYL